MKFTDNSFIVKTALELCCNKWLKDAAEIITERVKENQPADTGETRNAWKAEVDYENKQAVVGNSMKNAVWEEFGTGEFEAFGNGRKNGWVFRKDDRFYFTNGKKPKRPFQRAYEQSREEIKNQAADNLSEVMK